MGEWQRWGERERAEAKEEGFGKAEASMRRHIKKRNQSTPIEWATDPVDLANPQGKSFFILNFAPR